MFLIKGVEGVGGLEEGEGEGEEEGEGGQNSLTKLLYVSKSLTRYHVFELSYRYLLKHTLQDKIHVSLLFIK